MSCLTQLTLFKPRGSDKDAIRFVTWQQLRGCEAEAWVGQKPLSNRSHSVQSGAEGTHATAGITWHLPVSAHARRPCRVWGGGCEEIVRMRRGGDGVGRESLRQWRSAKFWTSFIYIKIKVGTVTNSALGYPYSQHGTLWQARGGP